VPARVGDLALVLLRKLCTALPNRFLSSIGNDEADALAARVRRRLLDTKGEGAMGKMRLVRWVSACVETQTAMAQRVLDERRSDVHATDQVSHAMLDHECLIMIQPAALSGLHLLERLLDSGSDSTPPVLIAVYELVRAIWRRNHEPTISHLRGNPRWWALLLRPLVVGEEHFYLQVFSPLPDDTPLEFQLAAVIFEICSVELYTMGGESQVMKPLKNSAIFTGERIALVYEKLRHLLFSHVGVMRPVNAMHHGCERYCNCRSRMRRNEQFAGVCVIFKPCSCDMRYPMI
jgi:hypothetical protein